nr:elicitor-responsive protein 1-like [Ipomoea batatas]GMC90038.1 elicitor-responsive protein 1-like [Ipomoea batatas]
MGRGILEVLLVDEEGIKDDHECILGCLNWLNPCKNARKPYVCVQYGNQQRLSCVGKRGLDRKRIWNEKFTFEVEYPALGQLGDEEQPQYKLIFRVMNKHKFSKDEFLGEARIHVKDILSLGMEKGRYEVRHQKYRVVELDKTYSGDISVAITFIKIGMGEDIASCKRSDIQAKTVI